MAAEIPQRRGSIPVNEEDSYSQDPTIRRQYWLDTASNSINEVLGRVRATVGLLPQACEAILRDGSHYEPGIALAAQSVPPAYQEQAAPLFTEIGDIVHEKGFRFQPSIITSREHREVGSSGYERYGEFDPEVPIPLLRQRLIAEGKMRPEEDPDDATYTIEGVDRARRLCGLTRLDLATGRVTVEVDEDAINDSYYFLLSARREEVMTREREILEELTGIATSAVADYESTVAFLDELARYMDGKFTSPQIRARHEELVLSKGGLLDFSDIMLEAKRLAFETGKWDHILTPQEILLRVGGRVNELYLQRPYIPLAIQDSLDVETAIEEVRGLRQGEGSMVVNNAIFDFERPCGFRLEELNNRGSTVKSPTIMDMHEGTEVVETESFKEQFADQLHVPFTRPEDWFYREDAQDPLESI